MASVVSPLILRAMNRKSIDPHRDRIRWNKRYKQEGMQAQWRKPSDFLVRHQQLLLQQPKGWSLDVACGAGRNAFYLATLGFRVEAVDLSDVAIRWLQHQVLEKQLPIHPKVANLENAQFPKQKYQVIININYLERTIFPTIKEALLPGGLLLFESFTKDHIRVTGRDIDPRFTLDHNELRWAFPGLLVLHYEESVIEDKASGRKKGVASLVARKTGGMDLDADKKGPPTTEKE